MLGPVQTLLRHTPSIAAHGYTYTAHYVAEAGWGLAWPRLGKCGGVS